MKRRGFSLLELMVVIAILALLVALVLPNIILKSLAHARSTLCRGNLRRLSDAFAAASSAEGVQEGTEATVHPVAHAYPKPMTWPGIPSNVVPAPDIYRCPEDEVKRSIGAMLKSLEYVCPYGRFALDKTEGLSSFYLARRGADETGSYTDYMLQDDYGNGQLQMMNFNGWFDTDGFVRVYDRGLVHIFDHVPNTPEFAGARGPGYPNRVNTCGDLNAIYYEGEPAFGAHGLVRNHRGKTYKLPHWGSDLTNYGINSYAYEYPYGTNCIVLVDYKETIVEIDTPLEAEELLLKSGRHLGKLNYLLASGAVKSAWPLEVSPRLHLPLWQP